MMRHWDVEPDALTDRITTVVWMLYTVFCEELYSFLVNFGHDYFQWTKEIQAGDNELSNEFDCYMAG